MNYRIIALVSVVALIVILGTTSVFGAVSSGVKSAIIDDNRIPAKLGSTCLTDIVTAATIGNQLSSNILATSTNRAYARIQRFTDSSGMATTGPVYLSFDEGARASVGNGLSLSTTTPYIEFGRNTDFPYDGTVTGITVTGSTTIQVTQCTF